MFKVCLLIALGVLAHPSFAQDGDGPGRVLSNCSSEIVGYIKNQIIARDDNKPVLCDTSQAAGDSGVYRMKFEQDRYCAINGIQRAEVVKFVRSSDDETELCRVKNSDLGAPINLPETAPVSTWFVIGLATKEIGDLPPISDPVHLVFLEQPDDVGDGVTLEFIPRPDDSPKVTLGGVNQTNGSMLISANTPQRANFNVRKDRGVELSARVIGVEDPSGMPISGYENTQFEVLQVSDPEGYRVRYQLATIDGQLALPTNAIYKLQFEYQPEGKSSRSVDLQLYGRASLGVRKPEYSELLTQLALARKVSADEQYLTSTVNCKVSFSAMSQCDEYIEIKALYEEACKEINFLFKLPQNMDGLTPCDGLAPEDQGGSIGREGLHKKDLATVDLLQADIKYRIALLDRGLPFLGGYRSLSMTTPHQELVKLRSIERRMGGLIDRIERLQTRFAEASFKAADVDVEIAYVTGQLQAEETNSQIAQYQASSLDADRAYYDQKKASLQEQIVEFANKIDELAEAQETLTKSASALVQQGIAAASGLPITDVEALASGDLKAVAESFVKDQVLSATGDYAKEFAASSELVASIAGEVKKVQAVISEVKAYEEDFDKVKLALDGDREAIEQLVQTYGSEEINKMLTVGTQLEEEINQAVEFVETIDIKRAEDFLRDVADERIKRELDKIAQQVMPFEAVMEEAYDQIAQLPDIQERVEQFKEYERLVGRAIDDIDNLDDKVEQYREELERQLRQGLRADQLEYMSHTAFEVIRGLDHEVKITAIGTLDIDRVLSTPSVRQALEQISQLPNGEDYKTKIRTGLLNVLGGATNDINSGGRYQVRISGREIRLRGNIRISLASLYQEFEAEGAYSADQLANFMTKMKDELKEKGIARLRFAMEGPKAAIQQIRSQISDRDLKDLWGRVNNSTNQVFAASMEKAGPREIAKMLISGQLDSEAEGLPAQLQQVRVNVRAEQASMNLPQEQNNYGAPGDTGLSPEANLALQTALNAALPGAGIALSLGQAWASMDANKELMDDYSDRLTATIAEYEQITRSKVEATRASAIAKLEWERANALRTAARVQLSEFADQLNTIGSEQRDIRDLLFLYRPYFFYLAELMRERFNAFDRSLALWSTGIGHAGYFNEQITEDPRNVRLALDGEIQLFNWLNRGGESTKSSPYYLFNHWQQLITLAEGYCSDHGCKPGDGKLGSIGSSVPVKLFKNLKGSKAKKAFKEWQGNQSRSGSLEVFLALVPEYKLIPASVVNARIVDINIVALDKDGKVLHGNRIEMRHSGFSRLLLFDRTMSEYKAVDEQLLPSSMLPPSNATPFDIRELRERFQTQNDITELLTLRSFEGYGVFGNYSMSILDGPDIELVDDFEIQISYTYQKPNEIRFEKDVLQYLTNDDGSDTEACNWSERDSEDNTGVDCYFQSTLTVRRMEFDEINNLYTCEDPIATINVIREGQYPTLSRLQSIQCVDVDSAATGFAPSEMESLDIDGLANTRHCSQSELMTLMRLSAKERNNYRCFGELE